MHGLLSPRQTMWLFATGVANDISERSSEPCRWASRSRTLVTADLRSTGEANLVNDGSVPLSVAASQGGEPARTTPTPWNYLSQTQCYQLRPRFPCADKPTLAVERSTPVPRDSNSQMHCRLHNTVIIQLDVKVMHAPCHFLAMACQSVCCERGLHHLYCVPSKWQTKVDLKWLKWRGDRQKLRWLWSYFSQCHSLIDSQRATHVVSCPVSKQGIFMRNVKIFVC